MLFCCFRVVFRACVLLLLLLLVLCSRCCSLSAEVFCYELVTFTFRSEGARGAEAPPVARETVVICFRSIDSNSPPVLGRGEGVGDGV